MNGFKFDAYKLAKKLGSMENKFDMAVSALADQGALAMQNSAKSNARWQDRTGAARQRLKGDSQAVSNGYRIRLAHGVDYGIWLELANEKRYAIIDETVRHVGDSEVMPAFQNLMDRLG